jgi:Fe2+ transport system protein FeoA
MRVPLDELKTGQKARVIEVHGGRGLCRHLEQMGIHSGDVIALTGAGAFRGPLLVEIHGCRLALGRGVARRVVVEPI